MFYGDRSQSQASGSCSLRKNRISICETEGETINSQLVKMVEPYKGRVFDPCCGSGGMFVQSERFVEEHGGRLCDYIEVNDSTYSPGEHWHYINYPDTGNITGNKVSEVRHLVAGKDKIPDRARRKIRPDDIVYSTLSLKLTYMKGNQLYFGNNQTQNLYCFVAV